MSKGFLKSLLLALSLLAATPAAHALDLMRAISAGVKAYQAYTLSDKELAQYVRESVDYMDRTNRVASSSSSYATRLKKLTSGLKSVGGTPLNFKVYITSDVNAFACADGSVRVYSGLMDIMDDEELLGIIGHEIGHVGLKHSKKAMKQELLTGALRDAVASTNGRAGVLASSALGSIGEYMISAKYSRTQEKEADDYGYDFLKKHGKNPWGIVQAFEKMQKLEGKSGTMSRYVNRMFSSHPDMAARIKRMKERCQKDGIRRP